jgi:hypothetical protein
VYFEIGPMALGAIVVTGLLSFMHGIIALSVRKDSYRLKAQAKMAGKIAAMNARYDKEEAIVKAQANLIQCRANRLTIEALTMAKINNLDVKSYSDFQKSKESIQ